jgi:DICT domain-containing protein
MAAFARSTRRRDGSIEVAIGPRSPLLREWAVICVAPRSSACLIGWEYPDRGRRTSRAFEAVWSVDAAVVQAAARAALATATEHAPRLHLPTVQSALARPTLDADRLVALTDRIVANLDDALERRP